MILIELYNLAGEDDKVTELCKKSSQLGDIYKNMLQDVEDKDISVIEECLGDLKVIQETMESLNDFIKLAQKLREMKEKFKESLQSMRNDLGENHPDVARYCSKVASSYDGYGWLVNSLEYYLKAYKIFVFRFGIYHMDTQAVYTNMKKVYSKWKPEGNFNQWLEEQMKENQR